jgi:hypothetical protein
MPVTPSARSTSGPTKTDANDAEGLGWYKEVRVNSFDAMLSKTFVAARDELLGISTGLSNEVRGVMKTFGLVVPKGALGSSKLMSGGCWPAKTRSLRSCCGCSSPSVPSAPAPPSSTGSYCARCGKTRIARG